MLAAAENAERAETKEPRFIVADVAADDQDIHSAIWHVLNVMADVTREDHRRNIGADDLLRAVEAGGLVVGTVHTSPNREDGVVELDYRACEDALAWAAVADLPGWIVQRYGDLMRARNRL